MRQQQKVREKLTDTAVDTELGLNGIQVAERIEKGYANDVKIGTSKSYWKIISDNVFTFFNFLCLAIFIWLITAARSFSDLKNITFFVIFVVNTLIGIIQEIKAKKTMDKMSLLSSPDVTVIREGAECSIKLNEILLDDITALSAGKQICSDSELISGEIEVNESMLTGESLPIKKVVGDPLLSGSFVVSGNGRAKVVNIAEQNYIQKLASEAKKFQKPESQLVKSMRLIMRVIGFLIIPVGIIAFFNNFNNALNGIRMTSDAMYGAVGCLSQYSKAEVFEAYRSAVFPTSTSLVGMIPAGMFLLTSVALAVGIVRLAKRKALVQELYSIETLARVDTLCLDKTGTITDGTMVVKDTLVLDKKTSADEIGRIISSMQYALAENNSTALALQNRYGMEKYYEADFVLPFASERKNSAVRFGEDLYVVGAPEYVSDKLSPTNQKLSESFVAQGMRCLLLAKFSGKIRGDKIPKATTPVALIVIEDNIKSDCIETIKYFKDNDVKVRVISGDNPLAVSVIAAKVGIDNAERYISLKDKSDEEVLALADDYTVFGRVNPSQKKLLVQAYKSKGHTVAMTGDGINDILALKEADCSIAMANGSEATRNVAQLVLLDSNFSSMPRIVAEGRRVVNNIERSSTLFLTKTLFSFIITILLVFMQKTIPLDPIQLSFTSLFAIGIPSFVLALEPNNARIKGNFINNIMKRITPGAIALVLSIVFMVILEDQALLQLTPEQMKTMCMLAIFAVFVLIIINISRPFNITRSVMLAFILVTAFSCVLFMPMLSNQDLNLFNVASLGNVTLIAVLISLIAISKVIMDSCNYVIEKYWGKVMLACKNAGGRIQGAFKPKKPETDEASIMPAQSEGVGIDAAVGLEIVLPEKSVKSKPAEKAEPSPASENKKAEIQNLKTADGRNLKTADGRKKSTSPKDDTASAVKKKSAAKAPAAGKTVSKAENAAPKKSGVSEKGNARAAKPKSETDKKA